MTAADFRTLVWNTFEASRRGLPMSQIESEIADACRRLDSTNNVMCSPVMVLLQSYRDRRINKPDVIKEINVLLKENGY